MNEDRFQLLRLLEATLFASAESLNEGQLRQRMPEGADIPGLLEELRDHYANRGVHLMQFEGRHAFRTAPDLGSSFHIEREVRRKLSRAAIETLAIIAYHQPVTRSEIEDIRGVVISRGTLDTLLEVGWIKPKGRRQTPGRPVTWATTETFLEHFGLESCEALPGVEELRAAGLLDRAAGLSTLGVQSLPRGGVPAEAEKEGLDGPEEAADDSYDGEALARLNPPIDAPSGARLVNLDDPGSADPDAMADPGDIPREHAARPRDQQAWFNAREPVAIQNDSQ